MAALVNKCIRVLQYPHRCFVWLSHTQTEGVPVSALCVAVSCTPWWRTRTMVSESWCYSRTNASSTTASPVQLPWFHSQPKSPPFSSLFSVTPDSLPVSAQVQPWWSGWWRRGRREISPRPWCWRRASWTRVSCCPRATCQKKAPRSNRPFWMTRTLCITL